MNPGNLAQGKDCVPRSYSIQTIAEYRLSPSPLQARSADPLALLP